MANQVIQDMLHMSRKVPLIQQQLHATFSSEELSKVTKEFQNLKMLERNLK